MNSDHIDFKKALDLLQFVPANDSELLDDLKLHIFAKAVLKDDWNAMDVDNPLQSVKDSTFFKLAEFCYLQGSSLEECFPLVEKLLADKEVQEMYGDDKNFEFLLRSGYEHMQRVSKEISEETAMETWKNFCDWFLFQNIGDKFVFLAFLNFWNKAIIVNTLITCAMRTSFI